MSIPADAIMFMSFRGSYSNNAILFGRHYRLFAGLEGDIDPQGLQEAFYNVIKATGTDDIQTDYLGCLPANYQLLETRVQLIWPTRFAYSTFTELASGAVAGEAPSGNLQGAITLRTNESGRNQIATYKIGPIPQGASVEGLLTNAHKVRLNSLGTKLLEQVEIIGAPYASAWFPVIYHPNATGPQPRFNVVEARSVHDETRTLSRRTVGRGI